MATEVAVAVCFGRWLLHVLFTRRKRPGGCTSKKSHIKDRAVANSASSATFATTSAWREAQGANPKSRAESAHVFKLSRSVSVLFQVLGQQVPEVVQTTILELYVGSFLAYQASSVFMLAYSTPGSAGLQGRKGLQCSAKLLLRVHVKPRRRNFDNGNVRIHCRKGLVTALTYAAGMF